MLAIIQGKGKGKGICFLRLPTRGGEVTLLPPGWSQALAPGEIEGRGPEFPADPFHPPPQDGEEWGAVVLAVQPATCRHAGINGLLSLLVNAALFHS